jgi:AraC family transcriptional regulator
MSITAKALWVIERNHQRDLTLDEIADACGVSKFHLAHAFGQSTGHSVIQYVRGRRLTEAARKLARGAPDILDLALETGYESHEGFSRAFKAQFGLTPETVRTRGKTDGLSLLEPIRLDQSADVAALRPRYEEKKGLLAVGLAATYEFGAVEGVAGQWQRFMTIIFPDIGHRLPTIPVGVASAVDMDGDFTYVTAAEVSSASDARADLEVVRVAPRRWAVFEHAGHITSLSRSFANIWDRWLPASNHAVAEAPSLERHQPTFDPRTGDGGVDIWIPIEG